MRTDTIYSRAIANRKLGANTMLGKSILSAIALCLSIAFAQQTVVQSSNVPKYKDKELLYPDGFRNWLFVGSNLGLLYKGEPPNVPTFHNIYLNPEAYPFFRDNGKFPDPTMLVMDIYESQDREEQGIVTRGSFNGKWGGNFVAVKDSRRPPGPNGEKTIWAYYMFFPDKSDPTKPQASAAAEADGDCENCHREHGKVDHVWVQFYPVLRDLAKK